MRFLAVALLICLAPCSALAQKIGVLPFEDASGVGPEFGQQVAKFIRSDLLRDKRYLAKFIPYKAPDEESAAIDVETALRLGKNNGVDYVLIGTILEAESSSSSTGVGGINVLNQSLGTSLRTVTASVTLQADLLSVKDGKLLESFRVSGSKTKRSVGADVSTEWGSFNSDRDGGSDTPNAQALREAVGKLVKELARRF